MSCFCNVHGLHQNGKSQHVVASVKVNVINSIKTWKLFVDKLHLIGNMNISTNTTLSLWFLYDFTQERVCFIHKPV